MWTRILLANIKREVGRLTLMGYLWLRALCSCVFGVGLWRTPPVAVSAPHSFIVFVSWSPACDLTPACPAVFGHLAFPSVPPTYLPPSTQGLGSLPLSHARQFCVQPTSSHGAREKADAMVSLEPAATSPGASVAPDLLSANNPGLGEADIRHFGLHGPSPGPGFQVRAQLVAAHICPPPSAQGT